MGFEPTVRCRTHAFQAGAIDHSATPPYHYSTQFQTWPRAYLGSGAARLAATYIIPAVNLLILAWHALKADRPTGLCPVRETGRNARAAGCCQRLSRGDLANPLNFLFLHVSGAPISGAIYRNTAS